MDGSVTVQIGASLEAAGRPGKTGAVVAALARAQRLAARVMGGNGVWSLGDQCAVSLGNFVTSIALVRSLMQNEYGLFGILLEVILLLNNLHGSVITYPLSVKGAKVDREAMGRMAGGSLGLTLLLGVPLGIALLVTTTVLSRWQLGLVAIFTLVLWQVQETMRRGLMAQLRYRDAFWGDAISYLGQAGALAALAFSGRLSLVMVFGIMALTSALGAALQAWQLGVARFRLPDLRELGRAYWALGQWNLYSSLTSVFTVPAFAWVLGYYHGLAVVALHQAFLSLMKVCHPVLFGMMNLIVPATAASMASQGMGSARRTFRMYAWGGGLLLMPYFAVLLIWPDGVVRLLFGADSPYAGHLLAVRLFALSYACIYVTNMYTAFLWGLERARPAFKAQLVNTVAAVAVGLPLAAAGGLIGCIVGGTLAVLARLGANLYYLREKA
jgi:O-antigen/teichoic acid export membrane protein